MQTRDSNDFLIVFLAYLNISLIENRVAAILAFFYADASICNRQAVYAAHPAQPFYHSTHVGC